MLKSIDYVESDPLRLLGMDVWHQPLAPDFFIESLGTLSLQPYALETSY